jgi:hypothetical protein
MHYPTDHCLPRRGIYNSRNPIMFLLRLCLAALMSVHALGTDWREPQSQLAQKIAAITGPGVIALEVTNRSGIAAPEAEQIRRALINALAESGVRVWRPDQAAATVQITLSENLASYVWVAEIRQGITPPCVVMVSASRTDSRSITQSAFPLTLHANLLISRPDRILDATIVGGLPLGMVTLSENAITVYANRDGHWIPGEPLKIEHDAPFPRDPRGRIIVRDDHLFDVYLPGYICHSVSTSPISLSCAHNDDPWPLDAGKARISAFFAPQRNFFTGALVPGIGKQKSAPAFYSAAAIPRDQYLLWVFAGVDGHVHLLDGITHQVAGKISWGSDLAGIRAACRPGTQVLATGAGDWREDSIQAFEFPDREPVIVSQKVMFNGLVTALWSAQDGQSATVVIRNLETGNYEAFLLTLTCGQ